MKFFSPFILLLGSMVSLSIQANAIPLNPRQKGIITLPLKRLQTQQGLHPQLVLQQHINRSHRRLARMTGREGPSDEELLERLVSREAQIRHSSHRVGHSGAGSESLAGNATTNTGFSPVDLKAAEDDIVTPGKPPTAQNSLSLSIDGNDVGYLAEFLIGTPSRKFSILMDSGSADFWVGGETCQSSSVPGADCGNHTFLGPKTSTSFVDTKVPFGVTYGTGSVNGTKITDDVTIAGLTLSGHNFGVAQLETVDFTNASFDGLMGSAISTLSQQQVLTPVESLAKQGLIQSATVSYKLSRLRDGANDGEVTFGGLDSSKFDQNTLVTINNVNQLGFWEAPMGAVTMNGQQLAVASNAAILDTGTTLMVWPNNDVVAIHQAIPGAKSNGNGGFTIPCTTNASLALTFGGQSFSIDSADLAFLPVDPNNPQGDCLSAITSGNIDGPTTVLAGDTFLKNSYFSTSVDTNTITLAKLK